MAVSNNFLNCYGFPIIPCLLWLLWVQATGADSTITVALYTDYNCNYPAQINKNITVAFNTCVLTPGAWGFIPPNLICTDGTQVQYRMYWSSACDGKYSNDEYSGVFGGCQRNSAGPVPGFVALCGDDKLVTVTSTVTFPAVTNLASAPAGSTKTTSTSAAGSTNGATGSTDGSGASPHGWSALSNGERIGAIIALAVGVPAVVIAAATLCIMRRSAR